MLFEKENKILKVLSQRGCTVESNLTGEIKKLFILGMFWIKMLFPDLWDMIDYIGIIDCEHCEGETYKNLYGIHQEIVEEKTSYHIILLDVGAFACGKNYREKADFAMQVFLHELAHFAAWEHNDKFFSYLDILIAKFNKKAEANIKNTYNADGM